MKLKDVLARELKNRNLSLRELSRRSDISTSVLHGWLNGVRPSGKNLESLARLSECLGVSLDTLLFNSRSLKKDSIILMTMEFKDGEGHYNLTIEKLKR